MTERLLRKEQAREFLGISRPTLDRMIDRGEIAVIRVSLRALRISETELRRLVDQRTERRGHGPFRYLVGPGTAQNGLDDEPSGSGTDTHGNKRAGHRAGYGP